jgi:hypothetical protein
MFDRDQFIADCQAALDGDTALRNVCNVVAWAVSDPGAVPRALGQPTAGGVIPLYRSSESHREGVPGPFMPPVLGAHLTGHFKSYQHRTNH